MSAATSGGSEHSPRSSAAITVLVVDDHPVFRAALVHLLRARKDIEVLAESALAGPGVAHLVTVHEPDVVVVGVHGSDDKALWAVRSMRRLRPQSEVLVIGELASQRQLLAAAEAGVSGYLASDAEGSLFEGLESLAHHTPYVPIDVIRRLVQAFADVAGVTRLQRREAGGQANGRDLAISGGNATANAARPGQQAAN